MLRARLRRSAASRLFVMGDALVGAQDKEYPHAFPRKGVTQILDNTRVTVWEVNWRHGDEQPCHRHRYDMAGVYLRYGPIMVTVLDGKANRARSSTVPRPYFQVKDITHREEAHAAGHARTAGDHGGPEGQRSPT